MHWLSSRPRQQVRLAVHRLVRRTPNEGVRRGVARGMSTMVLVHSWPQLWRSCMRWCHPCAARTKPQNSVRCLMTSSLPPTPTPLRRLRGRCQEGRAAGPGCQKQVRREELRDRFGQSTWKTCRQRRRPTINRPQAREQKGPGKSGLRRPAGRRLTISTQARVPLRASLPLPKDSVALQMTPPTPHRMHPVGLHAQLACPRTGSPRREGVARGETRVERAPRPVESLIRAMERRGQHVRWLRL